MWDEKITTETEMMQNHGIKTVMNLIIQSLGQILNTKTNFV